MRRLILLVLAATGMSLAAQSTNITASHVVDPSGGGLLTGRLCFQPTNGAEAPTGFRNGSLQVLPLEKCGTLTSGALAAFSLVPNITGTYYHVYIKAPVSNTVLWDYGMTPITGSSWTLDTYDPSLAVLPAATLTTGSVTPLSQGASPTASVTNNGGGSFSLNLGLPLGPTGPTGPTGGISGGTLTGALNVDTYAHGSTSLANLNAATATGGLTAQLPLTGWTAIHVHDNSWGVGVGASGNATTYWGDIATDMSLSYTTNVTNNSLGGDMLVDMVYKDFQNDNPGASSTVLDITGNAVNDANNTSTTRYNAQGGPGRWQGKYEAALFSKILQDAIPSTAKTIPTATTGWSTDTTYTSNHGVSCTTGCAAITLSYTAATAGQPVAIAIRAINGNLGTMTCTDSGAGSTVFLANTVTPWVATNNGVTEFPFVYVWQDSTRTTGAHTITCTPTSPNGQTVSILWSAPVPASGLNPQWVWGAPPQLNDGNALATQAYNDLAGNTVAAAQGLLGQSVVNWVDVRNCLAGGTAQAAASPNQALHLNDTGYRALANCIEAPTRAPHKKVVDTHRFAPIHLVTGSTDAISASDRGFSIWYNGTSVTVTLLPNYTSQVEGVTGVVGSGQTDRIHVLYTGSGSLSFVGASGTALLGTLSGMSLLPNCSVDLTPFYQGPGTFWEASAPNCAALNTNQAAGAQAIQTSTPANTSGYIMPFVNSGLTGWVMYENTSAGHWFVYTILTEPTTGGFSFYECAAVTVIAPPTGCKQAWNLPTNATNFTNGYSATLTQDTFTGSNTYLKPDVAGASVWDIEGPGSAVTVGDVPYFLTVKGQVQDSGVSYLKLLHDCGTITTTAATTPTPLTVTGFTTTGQVSVTPTNTAGATLKKGGYYVTKAAGTVSVNWQGTVVGSETFDVTCSLQ